MESCSSHINSIFNSVSYRVGNILIDAGDEWEGFRNVSLILLTHAHFDHIYGLNRAMELNPEALVITNGKGAQMLANDKLNLSRYHETPFTFKYPERIKLVTDSEKLKYEGKEIEIFETPGHNPSCLTFIIDENVFTGDAYIPGLKTVTNLPMGDKDEADESINKILSLSEGKNILAGHKEV